MRLESSKASFSNGSIELVADEKRQKFVSHRIDFRAIVLSDVGFSKRFRNITPQDLTNFRYHYELQGNSFSRFSTRHYFSLVKWQFHETILRCSFRCRNICLLNPVSIFSARSRGALVTLLWWFASVSLSRL